MLINLTLISHDDITESCQLSVFEL